MPDLPCPRCDRNFRQSSALTGHLKKCKELKQDLIEARANFGSSNPRDNTRNLTKALEWAEDLEVDAAPAITPTSEVGSPSSFDEPLLDVTEPTPPPSPPRGRGMRTRNPGYLLQQMQNYAMQGRLPFMPPPPPPPAPPALPLQNPDSNADGVPESIEEPPSHPEQSPFTTAKNPFGVYKQYVSVDPHYIDPEGFVDGEDLVESNVAAIIEQGSEGLNMAMLDSLLPSPCALRIAEWYWDEGSDKSMRSFQSLIDIIGRDDFQPADIKNTNWRKVYSILGLTVEENEAGDASDKEGFGAWFTETSWKRSDVPIQVPFDSDTAVPGTHRYWIRDFYHQPLVDVIQEKLSTVEAQERFHLLPYELRWQPRSSEPGVRLHGEIYTSPAFANAHQELQDSPPESDCTRPRHVIAIMFGSDKAQLATFGTAAVWPLYFFCGNESKYDRSRPSLKMGEQVAYFEELQDSFKDWVLAKAGDSWPKYRLAPLLTHCKRELFHVLWDVMLDDAFMEVYEHGIVIKWMDGLERRFFPRIFTYSADYPEKVLVATLRQMGNCPCPRCLIPLEDARNMGKVNDKKQRTTLARVDDSTWRYDVRKARQALYQENASIASAAVHNTLTARSLVPTENTFAKKLGPLGFNIFSVFATDILHEFELGVWKAIFLHLMRMLQEVKMKNVFDERFRQIPSFGRDTVRKFANNVSETKRLAARDYKDILQCVIPAMEGLFEEPHNSNVMDLLFSLAHWHGLAKLRMHSDDTVKILDTWTHTLGTNVRHFESQTCRHFGTVELDKEYAACQRRKAKKKMDKASKGEATEKAKETTSSKHGKAQGGPSQQPPATLTIRIPAPAQNAPSGKGTAKTKRKKAASVSDSAQSKRAKTRHAVADEVRSAPDPVAPPADATSQGKLAKSLSLSTYTYHSLGDVVACILLFGTTDSYSTQISELHHRFPKSNYRRTSRKKVMMQLSRIQMRQNRLRRLRHLFLPDPRDGMPPAVPSGRYFIGKSQHLPVYLGRFMDIHREDPAAKNFVSKLKCHLYQRIQHRRAQITNPGEVPSASDTNEATLSEEATKVVFQGERIFRHKLLYLNFTTYDIRQDQDIVNPSSDRRDVMFLRAPSSDDKAADKHHYVYGRILGIFHANVLLPGSDQSPQHWERFDFLWVRWFKPVQAERLWSSKRLDALTFPPLSDPNSVGFVDPADALQACHVIPRFSQGPAKLSKANFSLCARNRRDWKQYVANRFVDRDMVMRFHWGLGVGHLYSHKDKPSSPPNAVQESEPAGQPPRPGPSTRSSGLRNEPPALVASTSQIRPPASLQPSPNDTAFSRQDHGTQGVEDDDLDIVREAEAELHIDLEQNSPDYGERLTFILDDEEEIIEEDVDDTHEEAMYG